MSNNIHFEPKKPHHSFCNEGVKFPVWGSILGDINRQEDLIKLFSLLSKEDLKRIRLVSASEAAKDSRYYHSVHAAVKAAKEGDLVLIFDDHYKENVFISKDHITVRSLGGMYSQKGVFLHGNLTISARNVVVEGITVSGKTVIGSTGSQTTLNRMYLKGETFVTGEGEIRITDSFVRSLEVASRLNAEIYLVNCFSEEDAIWCMNSRTSALTLEACRMVTLVHNHGVVFAFATWFTSPRKDKYVIRSKSNSGKLFVYNSSARGMEGYRGRIEKVGCCDYQFSTFDFNREKSNLNGQEIDPGVNVVDYYTKKEITRLLELKLDKKSFERFKAEYFQTIKEIKESIHEKVNVDDLHEIIGSLEEKVDTHKEESDQEIAGLKEESEAGKQKMEELDENKVPYFDDKRILLNNHRNLLGMKTDGEGVNLAMVSKWDIADFGSVQLPLNLNAIERPTVQIGDQTGEEAEKMAFLKDLESIQDEIEQVKEIVSDLSSVEFREVEILPEEGESNVIYLVPTRDEEGSVEYYTQYVWIESKDEFIVLGITEFDLSGYYTKSEIDEVLEGISSDVESVLEGKQGKLTAGEYITIEDNVISADDMSYDDTKIKADITSLQDDKADKSDVYTKTEVDESLDEIVAELEETISCLEENKQNKLVEGQHIELVQNSDGTVTIHCNEFNSVKIVTELPETPQEEVLYLLITEDEPTTLFEKFVWEEDEWFSQGLVDVEIDLDNYYTKSETEFLLNNKADKSNLDNYLKVDATAKASEKLQTPVKINGVEFDGSTDVNVPIRFVGITELAQITNVNISQNYDLRCSKASSGTLSFTSQEIPDGSECIIAIRNIAASNIIITFQTENVQSEEIEMIIESGKIGEVSVRYLFGTYVLKVI